MRLSRLACRSLLSCVLAALPLAVNAASLSETDRARIDAVFKEHNKPTTPGCVVGVMRNGEPLYAQGYGTADLERNVPIRMGTLFDIASGSKQFTVTAVLLLARDGKLALSDDVRKYVPEVPDFGATITIDHLIRHTSGLRDYIALLLMAGRSFEEVTTQAQALEMISRQRRLNFPTGSRFEYSNTGYILMAEIVKRVSGKTLAEFARERIFLPLGMNEARFVDDMFALVPDRAVGYAPDGKGSYRLNRSNWQQVGDGSLHLSIFDAFKWLANFEQPQLGADLVDQLQQRGALADGKPIEYARGLFLNEYRGLARVEHGGDTGGFHSMMVRFPQQRVAIAVFCNADGIDVTALADRVTDIVLADALRKPKPTVAAASSTIAPILERFVGSYFSPDVNAVYQISQKENVLTLTLGSTSLSLKATGATTFAVEGYPVVVDFKAKNSDPAEALRLEIGSSTVIPAQKFVPSTPSPARVAEYEGVYYSPELDVTWPFAVAEGRLHLDTKSRFVEALGGPLDPAMTDAFSGTAGFIQFRRDAAGRVNGFDISSSRMRDIHFELRDARHVPTTSQKDPAPHRNTTTGSNS